MKIEQQVVSLELSRQLKELGVKQNSSFYWVDVFENLDGDEECWQVHYIGWFSQHNEVYHPISAPTSSELGEILPDYTRELGNLEISKCETDHTTMEPNRDGKSWWNVSYWDWKVVITPGNKHSHLEQNSKYLQQADTLADAMAQMKIYLLENKLKEVRE